jgi:hypothetical protein
MDTFRLGYNSSYLTEVPTGEPGLFSVSVMSNAFASAGIQSPNIAVYPANLFEYSINIQSLAATFIGSTRLIEIPENFFYGAANNQSFNNTFFACTNLNKLPNRLWRSDSQSAIRLIGIGMFRNTRSLNSIPPNFFDAVSSSIDSPVYRMFLMSSVINDLTGSIPPIWNAPNTSTWEVSAGGGDGIFGNCVSASNYNDIPAGWKLV